MGVVAVVFSVVLFGSLLMVPAQWTMFPGSERSVLFSGIPVVEAQAASSPWNRTFGGSLSDGGYGVVEVSTGGFACTGYTMSVGEGEQDVWLVRTGIDGVAQWSQTYGGNVSDWGRSIREVGGGGFIIVGETYSFGAGSTDVWVLRTSADGSLQWNYTYGGLFGDSGKAIVPVTGGGYAIAGTTANFGATSNDMWLLRIDANGTPLWNQTYGGMTSEAGLALVEVSTGGFVIVGWTNSFGIGSIDLWLVRTDSNGNLLWSRNYGGSGTEYGYSVVEVSTGGFAIAGKTTSFGAGLNDAWLLRTDPDGNRLWNYTYGGAASDQARAVQEVLGGGFAIAGQTQSFGAGNNDVWLLRTDADGTAVWNQTYGGLDFDQAHAITTVSAGGFAILGISHSFGSGDGDMWLIRVTEAGLFPLGFPIDPLLLLIGIVIIVVIVLVMVVLRRRGRNPSKGTRKKPK